MRRQRNRTPGISHRRSGLTLLETLLAIAILGGALAAAGELLRVGATAGIYARELTWAQVYADSKMSEVASGMLPLTNQPPTRLEYDPSWFYSIEIQPLDTPGMTAVMVLVEKDVAQGGEPVDFRLFRWMVDPSVEAELEAMNAELLGADDATGSATGGTP